MSSCLLNFFPGAEQVHAMFPALHCIALLNDDDDDDDKNAYDQYEQLYFYFFP